MQKAPAHKREGLYWAVPPPRYEGLCGLRHLALAFDEDHAAAERTFQSNRLAFAKDVRDGGVVAAECHYGAGDGFHLAAAAALLDGCTRHLAVANITLGIALLDGGRGHGSDEGLGFGHCSSVFLKLFFNPMLDRSIRNLDEGRRS